jgi:hypothetical protein
MSQVIGRVGNEVVLTSDVLVGVDDMITRAKGRIPASKVAEQRAALVQEVTAGIAELNAHYKEPDPVKSMSVSRRNLLYQLVQQQVNVKLIYQDFIKTVPKEAHAQIEETVARRFEELQLPALMKRENVSSRADLENSLLAKGSSMAREKRIFGEQILAQNWIQEKVSGEKDEKEVTHEEMLAWYQAHMAKYEIPAKARWEELMISFARHANHDEAYAAVAALGNRILAGATLADVAKSASDGLTARQGGVHEWTGKGSLSSEKLDQAVFSLPVGQLSQILESESGYHIIRVLERQELSRKSFLDVQKEIKGEIKADRFEKRYKEFVEGLREKYLVWTVFDNVMKPKANPEEEEDRYSRQ